MTQPAAGPPAAWPEPATAPATPAASNPLRRYRGLQVASIVLIVGGLLAMLGIGAVLLGEVGADLLGGALDSAGILIGLILAAVAFTTGLVMNAVRSIVVREALPPSRYRGPSVVVLLVLGTLVSVVGSLPVANEVSALQTGGELSPLGSMVVLTVTQLGLLAVGAVFVAIPRALDGVRLLPERGLGRSLLIGLGLAAPAWVVAQLIGSVVIALLGLLGLQPEADVAELAVARVDPVVLVAALVLVAPIAEEVFFRGLVYHAWEREYGPRRAVYGSAALFALIHGSIFNLLPIFVLGVVLASVVRRLRSLPAAMALHAGFNAISVALGLLVRYDVIRLP